VRNDHPVYDAIGSSYDEYSRTATFKRGECHSFDRQIGRLAGESVLDPACGLGFYSRRLKELGAGRVVGVDESTLAAAGFTSVAWVRWEVSAEDLRAYGAEYWRDFLDNCTGIGIDCRT
jgi:SAM-dependent methyltransferase